MAGRGLPGGSDLSHFPEPSEKTASSSSLGEMLEIPDAWQQEALAALRSGQDVIIDAPTGAGKTRVFEWWCESVGARRGGVVFTVPTRALANDKFREWQARGWRVGLITGDRTENSSAPVVVATLETQRERLLGGSPPKLLAVDEYQLLSHPERGMHYEIALALAPQSTQLLLLSGSVSNPLDVAEWLRRLGRSVVVVETRERPVPLEECSVDRLFARMGPSARRDGFWACVARGVLQAGWAPLLIFSPRRSEAERIARDLAGCLAPDASFHPNPEWRDILGTQEFSWLQRRVAVHHSGQSAVQRGEIIEPLAKYGHLDFLVATTGLAAGIHFSVRSVLVTETRFYDGRQERELRSDELLQMFGRAGRRGLDTCGTVLTLPQGAGLSVASQQPVRCPPQLDWAALLRAVEHQEDPLEALRHLGQRLFRSLPDMGMKTETDASLEHKISPEISSGSWRQEVLDPQMGWVPHHTGQLRHCRMEEAVGFYKDAWRPLLQIPLEAFYPGPGRLCRLLKGESFAYGREETVALQKSVGISQGEKTGYRLVGEVARQWATRRQETFSLEEVEAAVRMVLDTGEVSGRCWFDLRDKNGVVSVRWDYSSREVEAWVGKSGKLLVESPRRWVEAVVGVNLCWQGRSWVPPRGSLLRWWRELGLCEADGSPTVRGRIFSRFQGGEGLLIAAALEQADYAAEDIVRHLANVRGGHRFSEVPEQGSARLAAAARAVFGHRTIDGLLVDGLPRGYGENTAEALALFAEAGSAALNRWNTDAGRGDVERARLEWISLLRWIVRVTFSEEIPGWKKLVLAARMELERLPPEKPWRGIGGRWLQRARLRSWGKILDRL